MAANAQKQKNQQQMMELFGNTIAKLGGNVGQFLQKRKEQNAQQALGQQLNNAMSPAQGPSTIPIQGPPQQGQTMPIGGNQGPSQPPVDFGQLSSTFGKAYPNQSNPFIEGMAKRMMPKEQSPETMFQQQEMDLKRQKMALDLKQLDVDTMQKKADLLERQGNHEESIALRKQTIESNNAIREQQKQLMAMMFNARQNQNADTKNMGVGGWFRGLFGGGVTSSTVPVPGADAKSNARKALGLEP